MPAMVELNRKTIKEIKIKLDVFNNEKDEFDDEYQ